MSQSKHPAPDALAGVEILKKAQTVGETKARMPFVKTFALAVLAGIFIGMGGMFMLLVKADSELSFGVSSMLGGVAFSLGLFAVLVAGAELFTGNNLMVLGALGGRYGWGAVLKSWIVVYVGNLVGSLVLVCLLHFANFTGMGGEAVEATVLSVASTKCSLSFIVAFFRGILCNMLVCLAVWMGFAGKTVVDKFLAAIVPVCAFVACGFEHCVANMFFLPFGLVTLGSVGAPAGVDASALTLSGALSNLGACTLGNLVGGALIFAGLYAIAYREDLRS